MMKRGSRRGKNLALFLIVLTTLTIALSGCAGDKAEDSSKITIGIPQDIDSLDPHKAQGAGTREVLFNVYEGLVKPDENGNLNPAVASNYTISEDGKTYTFTLRDGIKFHNGNPVTVEDIKYSIDRCADTSKGDPLVPAFSNIDSVNILDQSHVSIVLKKTDTDFLSYLTTAIIPKENTDPESNPVGTGPYMYVSRSPQENVILKKFAGYWNTDNAAHIENVTFKVESNADAIVMDLEGGSIDMFARVTTTQASQLSDQFKVYEGEMNLVQALYLNNAVKPFDDVRVRQALCYAVDKKAVLDFVSDGKGELLGSSVYPSFSKYFVPELNNTYSLNLDKAKALLKEAGYPNGFTFTITVPSNYSQHVDTAQVLAQQLKQIGVTANIQQVEWNSWLEDVYTNRKYDATVIGVDAATLNAPALLSRFVSTADNNFTNYKNPDYDAAYAKAEAETDDSKKTQAFKECEKILSTDAANVYIQDLPEFVALNKKYTGYVFYPLYAQDIAKIRFADAGAGK